MIAPVPREGLKMGRRCGQGFDPSKAAAVPATVSGERDAQAFPMQGRQPLGTVLIGGNREGAHRAVTRKPGDLPAPWSLLP